MFRGLRCQEKKRAALTGAAIGLPTGVATALAIRNRQLSRQAGKILKGWKQSQGQMREALKGWNESIDSSARHTKAMMGGGDGLANLFKK